MYNFRIRLMLSGILFVLLLGVAAVSPARAHTPHDEVLELTLSPQYSVDGTAYLITPHWVHTATDLYRSLDGGITWHELSIGLHSVETLSALAVSPRFADDNTLYVSSHDGLFKSTNRGDTWQPVSSSGTIMDLMMSVNAADQTVLYAITIDGQLKRTLDGAVSWEDISPPAASLSVMATYGAAELASGILLGDEAGNIYIETPDRAGWSQKALPEAYRDHITAIAATADGSSLFVGTETGHILKSTDNGDSFQPFEQGVPVAEAIMSIALSPDYANDLTLFMATHDTAVFRSTDGAANWQLYDSVITIHHQATTRGVPHFDKIAVSDQFATDDTVLLGAYDGIFLSRDRGTSWVPLEANRIDLPIRMAIAPDFQNDPMVYLTTYSGGFLQMLNGDDEWQFENSGVARLRLYDVAISPNFAQDGDLFISGNYYVAYSSDRGVSWQVFNTVGQLFKRMAISPNYANDQTLFARSDRNILKSTDFGANWTTLWTGTGINSPLSVTVSPNYANDQTLFLHTDETGIRKSVNGGSTWQEVNNGLLLSRATSRTPMPDIVISPAYATDQTLFAVERSGLYRSTDGAASWQPLPGATWGDNYVIAMALAPNYPTDPTILVSVRGLGLMISHDDGATFAPTAADLTAANVVPRELYFSPTYASDQTIFALSDKVYRSEDQGVSWTALPKAARYEDLLDDTMLYPVGDWVTLSQLGPSTRSVLRSQTVGDSVQLFFDGNCLRYIGTRGPDQGVVGIYVDGVLRDQVDQYAASRQYGVIHAQYTDLADGVHSVKLMVQDTTNPLATNIGTELDTFETATFASNVGWCKAGAPTAIGLQATGANQMTFTVVGILGLAISLLLLLRLAVRRGSQGEA